MRILIVGGGAKLVQKLVTKLAQSENLIEKKIDQVILVDAFIEPTVLSGASFEIITKMVDISIGDAAESLIESKADRIFHFAAIFLVRPKMISKRATE